MENSNTWDPMKAFNTQFPGASVTPVTVPVAPTVVAPVAPVIPVATVAPTPVPPIPVASVTPGMQPVKEEVEDDYAGVAKAVSIGATSSRYPITKFKGVRNQIKRISFLFTDNVFEVYPHYEDGFGKQFYCFGGSCCETPKGEAKPRYLAPVIVYLNVSQTGEFPKDAAGNPILGEFEISYVALTKETNGSLGLLNQGFPLNTIDLKVSCTDDKMQKIQFIPSGPAFWRQNRDFAMAVANRYKEVKGYILRDFARKLGKTQEEQEANYRKIKVQQAEWARQKATGGQGAPVGYNSGAPTSQPPATAAPSDFNVDEFLA